jgi:hypothetical protein
MKKFIKRVIKIVFWSGVVALVIFSAVKTVELKRLESKVTLQAVSRPVAMNDDIINKRTKEVQSRAEHKARVVKFDEVEAKKTAIAEIQVEIDKAKEATQKAELSF